MSHISPTEPSDYPTPETSSAPFRHCICSILPVSTVSDCATERYAEWLSAGMNAGMGYMANHTALRQNPALVLDGARTIICMAFPFGAGLPYRPGQPRIAAYAQGEDYHDAIRQHLSPIITSLQEEYGGNWRLCIDSAPVMERYWAVVSGLAKPTRSGNVAVPGLGTRFFLAELLTDVDTSTLLKGSINQRLHFISRTIDSDSGLHSPHHVLHTCEETSSYEDASAETCGTCRRCLDACPGHAITPGGPLAGTVDARRCISYLTIEHRGPWSDPTALEVMDTPAGHLSLFGCDICQRVCPLNAGEGTCDTENGKSIKITPLPAFTPREEYLLITAEKAAQMSQEEFSATFRRSPVKRAKLAGWLRNAQGTP